jgi:excinuclease UvrABC nuclease subunit
VRAVLAFLRGQSDTPLKGLKTAMQAAAATADYETAARLRDRLAQVRWLQAALKHTAQAQAELTGVYQLSGTAGPLWCLLRRGQIGGICPSPHDRTSRQQARRWLRQVFQRPMALGRADDISVTWLVSSWFRRYPEEKQQLLPVAALV